MIAVVMFLGLAGVIWFLTIGKKRHDIGAQVQHAIENAESSIEIINAIDAAFEDKKMTNREAISIFSYLLFESFRHSYKHEKGTFQKHTQDTLTDLFGSYCKNNKVEK